MRVLPLYLMLVLFVSSCAGSATTQSPASSPPKPTLPAVAPATQPVASASTETSAAPVKTWVETGGFRKSEARYFAATGRPQFVEFFAFW